MNFPGNCYFNHEKRKTWIDIPKNASKTISHHLLRSKNWKPGSFVKEKIYDYNSYAIIRDPIDRWRGSTIEVAYHYFHIKNYDIIELEKWLEHKNWKNFDSIGDLHHQRMSYFVGGLTNITWISLDNNFEEKIKLHLGIDPPLVKINATEENEYKKIIAPYIDDMLSDNNFIDKLLLYYESDYNILSSLY